MIFKCPRCGSPIVNEYFDTSGQHWHCNNCGRNSHSYTLVYDNYTHQLRELSGKEYSYLANCGKKMQKAVQNNMDDIANIKIYKEDGKYYIDFILYDEAAEKTGYTAGLWADKRISKEKLDNLLNVIKKRSRGDTE